MKKIKVLSLVLGSALAVGIIGVSIVYANGRDESSTDETKNSIAAEIQKDESHDKSREEMISYYEGLLTKFNESHGTTYDFALEEESLSAQGKTYDEAVDEIISVYGDMSEDEFFAYMEEAYEREQEFTQKEIARGAVKIEE